MEGAWYLAGHNLTSLSEEQLIHCSGQVRSRTQLSCLEFVCFQVVLVMPQFLPCNPFLTSLRCVGLVTELRRRQPWPRHQLRDP